jgi:hypothetical protein
MEKDKEYVVHFPNGTVFKTSLAGSKREAREQGWIVECNAVIHGVGHGFKNKTDFTRRTSVTLE